MVNWNAKEERKFFIMQFDKIEISFQSDGDVHVMCVV